MLLTYLPVGVFLFVLVYNIAQTLPRIHRNGERLR